MAFMVLVSGQEGKKKDYTTSDENEHELMDQEDL